MMKDWLYHKYGFLNRHLLKPLEQKWWARQGDKKQQSFPDFMCIGAQKCGTTWLWENFKYHPDIFLPADRYIHFLNHHFNRPLWWYAQHFKAAGERKKGEIMPDYGLIEDYKISYLRKLLPELKLIFILRDPVDRAWSHARMALIQREQRAYASISEAEFIAHFHSDLSQTKGDYLNMLNKWQAVFPKEAIFIAYFEELSSSPELLLNKLFKHIGVQQIDDFSAFPIRQQINKGEDHPIPEHVKKTLEELYRNDIDQLYQLLGEPIQSWRV